MNKEYDRRVNLFIVGAMKSGTTTLHEYLNIHPDIYMSYEKEPGYFVDEIWLGKSENQYKKLFDSAKDEKYLGESSTHYTKLPTYTGVAQKIYNYNKSAKILYIVRHPIQRLISHYLHNRRDLMNHAERRPILTAIREEKAYISYSNYAMQIEPYLKLFGKENVKIVVFEKMILDPKVQLEHIFRWLELENHNEISKKIVTNSAPETYKIVRGFGILNKIRYSKNYELFSKYFPVTLKKIGNMLSEKKEIKKRNHNGEKAVYCNLKPIMVEIIDQMEKLTGESYDLWAL